MDEQELTPEQQQLGERLMADLLAHAARANVDLRAAMPDLYGHGAPHIEEDESGEWHTESFTVDVSGIVETLRALPDGAGTSAFVAAYNRTHPDRRDSPYRDG